MEKQIPTQPDPTPTTPAPQSNLDIGPKTAYPPPRFMSKKVAIMILLILFVLGSVSAFATFKLLSKPAPTPTPTPVMTSTPTPDPTADWKTYTGDDFSFKYPSNWTIIEQEGFVNLYPPDFPFEAPGEPDLFSPYISIYVTSNNPLECRGGCSLYENPSPMKIDGLDATSYKGRDGQMATMCGCNYEKIIAKKGDSYYLINLNGEAGKAPDFNPPPITSADKKVFDQVLSTFQFTNPIPSSECTAVVGDAEDTGLPPCSTGYVCEFTGDYPNRVGKCIKE